MGIKKREISVVGIKKGYFFVLDSIKVNAEIFKYKGFEFGLYWDCKNDRTVIKAVELKTGCLVKSFSKIESNKPKKELIEFIKDKVDNGELKKRLEETRYRLERYRQALEEEVVKFLELKFE